MSYTTWGVDSCPAATSQLANTVHTFSNGSAVFWCRYFSPSPSCGSVNLMDTETSPTPSQEAANMKAAGIRYILALCGPSYSNVHGGKYSVGYSDGQTFCQAINNTMKATNYAIELSPTTSECRVYLDVEDGSYLTLGYWQGWHDAVLNYSSVGGSFPYFPCVYVNPKTSGVCGILANPIADGIWSNEPESGYGCNIPGPAWNPPTAPYRCSGINTLIWQYAESPATCTNFSNFDLDESTPGETETYYMLYIP